MKITNKVLVGIISFFIFLQGLAQDSTDFKPSLPSGVFISYGLGSYSVRDEYISKQRYSGILHCFDIEWVRFNDKNAYRLEFEYRNSDKISNNEISAKVGQFTFNQDFIYSIGKISIFPKDIYAYLGPSVQVFYYGINYNFAAPGTFISPKTFGLIASMGINSDFIYQFNNKLLVESFLHLNLISFCYKDNDVQEYGDKSSPVLTSVFTATKFDFTLSVRYYLVHHVSISLGYRFDLSRIAKWDPYIAASNSFLTSLNYEF